MAPILLSSPLQGFTDFRFRNAHETNFGGIDTYYAPYIRLNGRLIIKPSFDKDIQPKNNKHTHIIPQIMTNSAEEFIFVTNFVQSLGYRELNWNLGCPYPMVTNRGLGSGLICQPTKIDDILQQVHNETDITVSMKMRLGFETPDEILATLPILEKYPLKNIAIHARIGKQLYNGGVDLNAFERVTKNTDHTLYYNGDITSLSFFEELEDRFPTINHWMLGRGLIANPFLPTMIKERSQALPDYKLDSFARFHDELFEAFHEKLSGEKHVIMKMLSYWEYFSILFPDHKKMLKKLSKTKTYDDYDTIADEILGRKIADWR